MNIDIYKLNGTNIDGINVFIDSVNLEGNNKKFVKLYNKIAPFYYLSMKIFGKLKFNGEKYFRKDFLDKIIINDNDIVLETSVGTADNFFYLNKNAKYYGVDISMEMLKMAVKHVKKWKTNAEFVCCEAENLPFNDNVFNIVYSCGGFIFIMTRKRQFQK